MKNKAVTFIEIIVTMALFFISLFPLIKYTQFSFATNRRYSNLEKNLINFKALESQLKAKDSKFLKSYLGWQEYDFETFGRDELTKNMYLPYPLNKNTSLKLEISEIEYLAKDEKYSYLEIYLMYIDSNKSFESKNLVSNW